MKVALTGGTGYIGDPPTSPRRLRKSRLAALLAWLPFFASAVLAADEPLTLNQPDTGYRGIWYYNQKSNDEYVYKYSGGLGTYCAKHQPFAVYRPEVQKTFFCYGGSAENDNRRLLHLVSYYDHKTGQVPRPTVLLDKRTNDAHDNPVISIDADGYIWISRPRMDAAGRPTSTKASGRMTSASSNGSRQPIATTGKTARSRTSPICRLGMFPARVSPLSSPATTTQPSGPVFL